MNAQPTPDQMGFLLGGGGDGQFWILLDQGGDLKG